MELVVRHLEAALEHRSKGDTESRTRYSLGIQSSVSSLEHIYSNHRAASNHHHYREEMNATNYI